MEWQLFTPDMSGPPTEAVIEQSFKENPSFSATEDQPFKLSEAFDVGLKVNAEPQEVQFSLKLSIPEGTVIKLNGEVLEPTVIGGQADPDQPSVWVITGTGVRPISRPCSTAWRSRRRRTSMTILAV